MDPKDDDVFPFESEAARDAAVVNFIDIANDDVALLRSAVGKLYSACTMIRFLGKAQPDSNVYAVATQEIERIFGEAGEAAAVAREALARLEAGRRKAAAPQRANVRGRGSRRGKGRT